MIDNLKHDKMSKEISWQYIGEKIRITSNFDLSSVRNDKERNLVCVVSRIKGSLTRLAYYSYSGEKLIDVNILNNELAFYFKAKKNIIKYENIKIVEYFPQSNIVLLGVGSGNYAESIIGLSIDGKKIFNILPPDGTKFWYFGLFDGKPNVSCIGGEHNREDYGRSGVWYEIEINNGNLKKRDIAY